MANQIVNFGVSSLISNTKDAISDLREINTLLKEISRTTSKLSGSDLEKIGNNSFIVASKYGKSAIDYLSGVQEAARAGYANADAIAELSVAAQSAGDLTAGLANQYIMATDQAYKLGGSVEKLTAVLDGSSHITANHAINMTELAEGMSIVGSTAASLGVDVGETTAALATMIATTKQGGSEVANAFEEILLNVRQISESNPMEVLRDLSIEYNKLKDSDIRKTDLLSSVGSQSSAAQLDALLRQWDTYETMLDQYASGAGSMAAAAEKTADSWEGSLNRLSNTWTDTIGNIADSDAVVTAINGLNGLLTVVNHVTDALGPLGSIGLGAGLFAGVQNAGKCRMSVRIS